MGTRIVAALIGGALLSAAALLVLTPAPVEPVAPTSSSRAPTPSVPRTQPSDARDALSPATSSVREPASPAPRPDHERTLRVVDEHGRPVEGAEVEWRRPPPLYRHGFARGSNPTIAFDEPPEDRSDRARTDDAGEVTITDDRTVVLIEVIREGRYGSGQIALDAPGPARMTIDDSEALSLRTVDRAGNAVGGIPLLVLDRKTKTRRWRGVTRARDGVVGCPKPARFPACEVALQLPFDDLAPLPITAADLARGSLTVRLPPGAPLRISLRTPDGAPFTEPTLVWLRDVDRSAWSSASRTNGEWQLPWYPLARTVHVDAVPVDRRFVPVSLQATGPVRTGQGIDVELRFDGADRAPLSEDVLTATLVTVAGEPMAGRRIEWCLDGARGAEWTPGWIETDPSGRLRMPYESFSPPSESLSIVFLDTDDHGESRAARVDVSGRFLPGGAPLGTIVMSRAAIAAAGIVVQPDGRPIAGAEVTLRDTHRQTLDTTISDQDGRFELQHPTTTDPLLVQARSDRHLSAPARSCRAGASGLTLTLAPAAGVSGRVRLDEGIDPRHLELRVVQGLRSRTVELDDDGGFEVWGFTTGTCTFKARIAGEITNIERIIGIPVRAGERTDDPRLAAIDLRGKLHPVTVTVVDADGAPVRAAVRVAGTSRNPAIVTDPDGRAVLIRCELPLRVEVSPMRSGDAPLPHRRGVVRVDVESDQVVVLAD